MAAALIQFDENFAQHLLSKNHVLLRLLIKCGSYKSAATNTVFTVLEHMILPIISELSGLLCKGETEASVAMIDSIPLSFFRAKEAINGENTAKNGNHICCWLLSFFCFRMETFLGI